MNRIALPSVLVALSLVACGGGAGAPEDTSAHGREPTRAWAADEPVPPGTPEFTTDEVAEGDEHEDTTPELDQSKQDGDVAQTSSALSTTTGTTFKLTYYWIAQRPVNDLNQVTLRDCDGKFLTYASYSWRDQVRMEMTGRFTKSDGTKVTFNDWGGCWKVLGSDYSWGAGEYNTSTNSSYKLRPFRSIAVDPAYLKIGKWYYVKELDGAKMAYPNSTMIHDGCVRAVDSSWSFSGKQIDFYTGLKSAYTTLNTNGQLAGRTSVTMYEGTTKCATHIAQGY
jgi:hypothetical protein